MQGSTPHTHTHTQTDTDTHTHTDKQTDTHEEDGRDAYDFWNSFFRFF